MDKCDFSQIDHECRVSLVNDLKEMIRILSSRIRDLRVSVQKKTNYLNHLMHKVAGPWCESKFAPAISYIKTQILKSNACINKMLQSIDEIGFHIWVLNGVGIHYCRGIGANVPLESQGNYICLRKLDEDCLNQVPDKSLLCEVLKQRSEEWFDLRKNAVVTGSSIHRALGVSTLKEQKEHHDKVFKGIEKKLSPELQNLFDHGTRNEIHALGTFVGKILPVYFPELTFKEDGCSILRTETKTAPYAVVSGDGTCETIGGQNIVAVEFKCPMPNKQYSTDVYYNLPSYYALQVMSQMKAKGCASFANLCYTDNSSTLIIGENNSDLWSEAWSLATEMYGHGPGKRPTTRDPRSRVLGTRLKEYSEQCNFIAEFPSLKAIACNCCEMTASPADAFCRHEASTSTHSTCDTDTCQIVLHAVTEELREAYQQLRISAKEILLGVKSDLDRTVNAEKPDMPHAVPFMYYMSGPSLKMSAMKGILLNALREMELHGIKVRVIAFDGQFLELAVSDIDGKPTTLCRLDKAVWEKSKKVIKELQVKFFTEMNYIGPVHDSTDLTNSFEIGRHTDGAVVLGLKNPQPIYIPSNLSKYVNANEQGASEMSEGNEDEIISEDYIIQYPPSEVTSALDDDSIQALKQISCAIQNTQATEDNKKDSIGDVYTISMDVMHDALKSSSQSSARKLKWQQNTSVNN